LKKLNQDIQRSFLIPEISNDPTLLNIIKDLKNQLTLSSSQNKQLEAQNERIIFLESENKKLLLTLQSNIEKYNVELRQRTEDFEFIKNAYDDQKNKHLRESETFSKSIMDITMKFMILKDSLVAKNTANKIKKK
jgi:hypothetical protein